MIVPKKKKDHKHSNVLDNDLRKLSRTVLRDEKNDVELVMTNNDGSQYVAENFKVSPQFAAITDKILQENVKKLDAQQRLKAMMALTEVWDPSMVTPKAEETIKEKPKKVRKPRKKKTEDSTEEKPKKVRKPRKKKTEDNINF